MADPDWEVALQALHVLYGGTAPPEQLQAANAWLEAFRRRPTAWTFADQMVRRADLGMSVQYFGANTLQSKIRRDFSQLPTEAHGSLQQSILALVQQFQHGGAPQIRTQLCLALADLAVLQPDWADPLQDFVRIFGSEGDNGMLILLELLTLFPEQARDDRLVVDKARRQQVCAYLSNHSEWLIRIMVGYATGAQDNRDLLTRIFKCLLAWLQSKLLSIDAFAASPFFDAAFQALRTPELSDVAVDVLIAVVDLSGQAFHYGELIERLVPAIIDLRPMYEQAVAEDDVDQARGLNRIFVGTAEAYLDILSKEPAVFAPLLDLLLLCTQHVDLDLAQMNFYFWHRLAHRIENYRDDVGDAFRPYYLRLIEIIVRHLRYEAEDSDESAWTAERREEFSRFRHDIGDILKDCCDAITSQYCLAKVFDLIRQALAANSHWIYVEAALFALRAMSSVVVVDNAPVLRDIMALLLSSDLPRHPKVRYTVTNILGQYSAWSRSNPDYLEREILYILSGFDDPDIAPASALALKRMAERCDSLLTGILDQVMAFHSSGMAQLRPEDQLEITDALAYIVRALPPASVPSYLMTLTSPILERMRELTFSPSTASLRELKGPLTSLLNRLTVIFKRFPGKASTAAAAANGAAAQAALTSIIEAAWPVIKQIFARYRAVHSVVDHACRCIRYAFGACRTAFVPIFDDVVNEILQGFAMYKYPPYVICAREMAKAMNVIPGGEAGVLRLLVGLSQTAMALLSAQGAAGFVEYGEVVEEYFYFAEYYAASAPALLAGAPAAPQEAVLPAQVQFAAAALRYLDGDGVGSVINFIKALLDSLMDAERPPAFEALLSQLLAGSRLHEVHGAEIVAALVQGAVEQYSIGACEDAAAVVYLLLKTKPADARAWLTAATANLPDLILPVERQRFLHEVMDANGGSRDSVTYSFRELSRLCRSRKAGPERSMSGSPGPR